MAVSDMSYLDQLKQFEGNVPHLYLDTKGIHTAGVGFMFSTLDAAKRLPWEGDIGKDWATLKEARKVLGFHPDRYTARWYRVACKARLSQQAIDEELVVRVGRAKDRLPGWCTQLPAPAYGVVLDIAYNTGSFSPKEWPKMTAALKRGDYLTAATESFRPDVGRARNDWAHYQLLSCFGVR